MTVFEKVERRPLATLAILAFLMFLPGLFTLPPVDRDEARFAQASRQMVETGNLVDIRFQNEPRYKKPIGIYWLQAGFARVFGPDHIWPYRLPSFFGAIGAVLLTFWAGKPLIGARGALIGAAFLASSILLNYEARTATTDAVQLAAIVGAMGVLIRAYLGEKVDLKLALLFWAVLGAGILIKGPIAPLLIGLTILATGMLTGKWNYLKALRPLPGAFLLVLIVAPWAIAIQLASHGEFFRTAIGGDLMPKIAGGQESHGAPSGYYLALTLVTFWPGVIVLGPALVEAFKARKTPVFMFLLAWAAPFWLLFELIPTKLPHYVLPVYPALALICGAWVVQHGLSLKKIPLIAWGALVNFLLVAIVLAAGFVLLRPLADSLCSPLDAPPAVALLLAAAGTFGYATRKEMLKTVQGALICGLVAMAGVFGVMLPSLISPWLAPRVAALVPHDDQGVARPLIIAGISEPSLIFATRTDTRFVQPAEAAAILMDEPQTVAAIAATADAAFQKAAVDQGLKLAPLGTLEGYNYSVGDPVTITLFERSGTP